MKKIIYILLVLLFGSAAIFLTVSNDQDAKVVTASPETPVETTTYSDQYGFTSYTRLIDSEYGYVCYQAIRNDTSDIWCSRLGE